MVIQQDFNSIKRERKKALAVLLDPDKLNDGFLSDRISLCNSHQVDFLFIGGSLVGGESIDESLSKIKSQTNIPIILFPGSVFQLSAQANAVLFLSLVSGRNPEYLIGNQVIAAPYIKKMDIEALSTAYMLIDAGGMTTASYISGTMPIPGNKDGIALATAQAAELLGFRNLYLDAGSGAKNPIRSSMIKGIASNCDVPLIVGGGITNVKDAKNAWLAGADIVVVGNAIEKEPLLIQEFSITKNSL